MPAVDESVQVKEFDYETLKRIETPPATATWIPTSHYDALQSVRAALDQQSVPISHVQCNLLRSGKRMFCMFRVGPDAIGNWIGSAGLGDVYLSWAVVNSLDMSLPLGVLEGYDIPHLGLRIYYRDIVHCKRTARSEDRTSRQVAKAVEGIESARLEGSAKIDQYLRTAVSDMHGESLLLRCLERDILSPRDIYKAIKRWRSLSEEERNMLDVFVIISLVMQLSAKSNPNRFIQRCLKLQALLAE